MTIGFVSCGFSRWGSGPVEGTWPDSVRLRHLLQDFVAPPQEAIHIIALQEQMFSDQPKNGDRRGKGKGSLISVRLSDKAAKK